MADIILLNATILTMQPEEPQVEAIALRGERILAVGSEAEVRIFASSDAECIDLSGQTMLPGFHDSHVHLAQHGFELTQVNLADAATQDEALAQIREKAETTPKGEWILGAGFLMSRWGVRTLHRGDLDAAAPDHPVLLRSQDHHSAWVNTRALKDSGVTATTPVQDGEIVLDDAGEPSGLLLERALHLVWDHVPSPTTEQIKEAVQAAGQDLAALGITTVHHMDYEPASYFREIALAASRADYPVRVWACLPQEDVEMAAKLGIATGQGGDHFQIGGAKFFADGALGSLTAHMLAPYDGYDTTGTEIHGREVLNKRLPVAIEAGLVPVIHAIGDAANRGALDALEATRHLWQPLGMRPRIEHVQHLNPADAARFAKLGIIASMQPVHLRFDAPRIAELLTSRQDEAHSWRRLLEAGAAIALGSDTPVATPNVLLGIHTALTREDETGHVHTQGQRMTMPEILAGYTRHAAYAIGWEERSGQLKAGFDADLVVLNHNPLEDPTDLQVNATMKAGRWTFQR